LSIDGLQFADHEFAAETLHEGVGVARVRKSPDRPNSIGLRMLAEWGEAPVCSTLKGCGWGVDAN